MLRQLVWVQRYNACRYAVRVPVSLVYSAPICGTHIRVLKLVSHNPRLTQEDRRDTPGPRTSRCVNDDSRLRRW